MVGSKRAIHVFAAESETGVYYVPEGALVLIESTWELYFKVDNLGLTTASTIADAIGQDKLRSPMNVWNKDNDGVGSDLDAALWGGHRLINISTSEPTSGDGVSGDIWFQRDV